MNDFLEAIDEINELIRAGKSDAARLKLDKVCRSSPPPRIAFALAELAKRVGQPSLAVRLLTPVVRPKESDEIGGTAYEQAEYALNLMRLGGRDEAFKILQNIDSKKFPVVALYRAWSAGMSWDHSTAINHFKEYLAWKDAPAHQRLVARVSLCEALVAEEKFSDSDLRLEDLIKLTGEKNQKQLQNQLYELSVQACAMKQDFEGARRWLERCDDALFVKKWLMILELAGNKNSTSGRAQNDEVKKEATLLKRWETVRECDRALAVWTGDAAAAERALFGTPFEAYRTKLLKSLTDRFTLKQTFDWKLGNASPHSPVFHLTTGEIEGATGKVKVGQAVHRLLTAVASDHYRPFPLVGIFAAVYPEENYHHVTSTMRVHRVIQRFREWVKESNLPLEIEYHNDGYSLVANGPIVIRHELKANAASREEVWVDKVRELSQSESFTRADVEKWLGISQTSAHRFLKQASSDGYFMASGKGNSKRYVWPTAQKIAA